MNFKEFYLKTWNYKIGVVFNLKNAIIKLRLFILINNIKNKDIYMIFIKSQNVSKMLLGFALLGGSLSLSAMEAEETKQSVTIKALIDQYLQAQVDNEEIECKIKAQVKDLDLQERYDLFFDGLASFESAERNDFAVEWYSRYSYRFLQKSTIKEDESYLKLIATYRGVIKNLKRLGYTGFWILRLNRLGPDMVLSDPLSDDFDTMHFDTMRQVADVMYVDPMIYDAVVKDYNSNPENTKNS